jgi:hypothetical protein
MATARVRQYVTEDGDSLSIDDSRNNIQIAWFCDGDYGMYVGEPFDGMESKEPPSVKDSWEIWIVHQTIKVFSDGTSKNRGFYFDTMAKAKKALKAANIALNEGMSKAAWPEWAIQAQAAGWTPPSGWKP